MNILSISVSISVTMADIWTNFGTKLKYHTVNTPEWSNSHNLKIQDSIARHLVFRKNVNNSRSYNDICSKFYKRMSHGDDHVTKSWNRKFIRVTSSDERLKHKCVYLSNEQIFEPNLVQTTTTALSTRRNGQIHITWKSKMAAAAILSFEKMLITPDWIKISASNCTG